MSVVKVNAKSATTLPGSARSVLSDLIHCSFPYKSIGKGSFSACASRYNTLSGPLLGRSFYDDIHLAQEMVVSFLLRAS